MSDELKPCPFCGGMAEIVEIDEGENAGGSCVCCTTCLASSKVDFGFKENFISNWNRRVQTLAPDAGIAAAAQVLLDACPNPIFDQLKPALMGEVTERVGYTDEYGNEAYYDRPVSWDAMKEIIRATLAIMTGAAKGASDGGL